MLCIYQVPEWIGKKPLIVAMVRIDQVPPQTIADWKSYFRKHPPHADRDPSYPSKVFFVNGKDGTGTNGLKAEALLAGTMINLKRKQRGMKARPVRAAVIGFPNVGKSALINRILQRKVAKSVDKPGVTRSLQWIRLSADSNEAAENTIELLDSPGIIPASQIDQESAMMLAVCNDIGGASYDRVTAAIAMCQKLKDISAVKSTYSSLTTLSKKYGVSFQDLTADEIVQEIAAKHCQESLSSAADKLLGDFRHGRLGLIGLEAPPHIDLKKTNSHLHSNKPLKETNSNNSKFSKVIKNRSFVNSFSELSNDTSSTGEVIKEGRYDGW
jgi:ribosome biogenesis GTPase A